MCRGACEAPVLLLCCRKRVFGETAEAALAEKQAALKRLTGPFSGRKREKLSKELGEPEERLRLLTEQLAREEISV